jgi:predicted peroxiredoxin
MEMQTKAAVSLTTGLEDAEKVTIAMLVAVAAAERGRPTLMFLTKEAVRLATTGFARAVACEGCPPLEGLFERFRAAGGELLVCPICFNARYVEDVALESNAKLGGTVQMWDWIGDEPVTTFSY